MFTCLGCCDHTCTTYTMGVSVAATCPGAGIPGCSVNVTGPDYDLTVTSLTSHYVFPGIVVGNTYTVTVTLPDTGGLYVPPRWQSLNPKTITPSKCGDGVSFFIDLACGYFCSCGCEYPISNRMYVHYWVTTIGFTNCPGTLPPTSPLKILCAGDVPNPDSFPANRACEGWYGEAIDPVTGWDIQIFLGYSDQSAIYFVESTFLQGAPGHQVYRGGAINVANVPSGMTPPLSCPPNFFQSGSFLFGQCGFTQGGQGVYTYWWAEEAPPVCYYMGMMAWEPEAVPFVAAPIIWVEPEAIEPSPKRNQWIKS